MKRILITGSSGFIGSQLVEHLLKKDFEVITLDKTQTTGTSFCIDIQNPDVIELIASIKPEAVIHLAAQVDVNKSFVDPAEDLLTNSLGTLNVLNGAIKVGVSHFVYITSGGAIYDSKQPLPVTETGNLKPLSPYGISKLSGEFYVQALCEQSKIEWSSLALSNCYGPVSVHKSGVIFEWWNGLRNGKVININGLDTSRDFIFITDVVRAIHMVLERPVNRRINISSGIETSLGELFTHLTGVMGVTATPLIKELPKGEIHRSTLDNTVAKTTIGWIPEIALKEGITLSLSGNF
jgi:UDP-glucose 4-epimerase